MDSSLKFGATYTFAQEVTGILEFGQIIEELGFDSLWAPDHIVCRWPILDCLTVLTAFASVTRRIELGPAVLIVPLRNPVVLAKAVATLDIVSKGRFLFGVGVGGEHAVEFEACGVPIAERGPRTDEALEVMERLWSGETTSYNGKFYNFSHVRMEPAPLTRPAPPIYIGGRAGASLRRAARFGDVFFPFFLSPDSYAKRLTLVREQAKEFGRDPSSIGAAHYLHFYVGNSTQQAIQVAAETLAQRHLLNLEYAYGLVDKVCAVGTAQQVLERVHAFINAGATHIVLEPLCAGSEVARQYEIAAQRIVPDLRVTRVH